MKNIISPIQNIQNKHNDMALMLKMMADLIKIHRQFLEKHSELKTMVNAPLKKGDKGDKPTRQEILDLLNQVVKDHQIEEIVKRNLPIIKDGESPSDEKLVSLIRPLIPEMRDKKIVITDEHIDILTKRVLSKIKAPEQKNNEIDIENLLSLIEKRPKGKRIKLDFVDGLDQTIQSLSSQITSKGYIRGGGDVVVAGSNITITKNANGNKIISSTGGGGSSGFQIPLSGVVDGINRTFTWANAPNAIIVDDGNIMQKADQIPNPPGSVNWTGTTTTIMTVPPNYSIYAVA